MQGLPTIVVFLVHMALTQATVLESSSTYLSLQLLPADQGARCLDGSPSGFYYKYGSGDGINKWVFYFQGGGVCESEESCTDRSKGDLGSSNGWGPTKQGGEPLQNDNPVSNPLAYDWNYIYIPYCDGQVHSGGRTDANEQTWNLYFSGHITVEVMMRELVKYANFGNATEVIVGGGSAGGFGTFANIDYIAALAPKAKTVGFPNAGYFISVDTFPGSGYPTLEEVVREMYPVAHNYVNQACVLHNVQEPALCGLPPNAFPYIKSPLFVVEANTDTNQLYSQDGCPNQPNDPAVQDYYVYFSEQMTLQSQVLVADGRTGLFMPDCLIHGVDTKNIYIEGINAYDAFYGWYNATLDGSQNGATNVTLVDSCGINCNPSCAAFFKRFDVSRK